MPVPSPCTKPFAPPSFAPSTGAATNPTAPIVTPLRADLTPLAAPAVAFFGRRSEKRLGRSSSYPFSLVATAPSGEAAGAATTVRAVDSAVDMRLAFGDSAEGDTSLPHRLLE
eukprot:4772556-Prymnesium_polylepis.2